MSGIRSFMGWTHVPDMDSSNPSDDNPYAGPKAPVPNKESVQMPTEEWLCKKIGKLNLTLIEGYPSRTAEAGHLSMDQYLRPPRSQNKWYGLYPGQASDSSTVSSWNTGPSKPNSSFGRISRKTGMTSIPPASRRISQDTLRKWEKSARICNQAASFNRCLFKVQQEMQSQLKTIHGESKGKGSKKMSEASDELQFIMTFNSSITQAAAKVMEHLTDFVFITMGNSTLARRDAYLSHLKNGIKPDTFATLRTASLQIGTLFPDSIIKRAEEEISHYDSKGQSAAYGRGKACYHPYERPDTKKSESRSEGKQERPAWKNIGRRQFKRGRGRSTNFSSRSAKGQQSYKWQSLFNPVPRETAGREQHSRTDFELFECKLKCCQPCHFCSQAFPKERSKSRDSRLSLHKARIKICEQCFLCHSIVLCQSCSMCPKCCSKSACRGQTSNFLANLAGSRCWSEGGSNFERGLHPPLPDPATSHKVSLSCKLLCQSSQEQLPVRGITSAYGQKRRRAGPQPNIAGFLQPVISSPKTQPQVETHFRPEQVKPFPQGRKIQNGDTGNHQDIPPTRGVGHLNRLQRCLLPYTNTGTVQEISEIPCRGPDIPIQGSTLWPVHGTPGVHCGSKGGEADGHAPGYKDPPIPRRLVGEGQIPPGLSPTYSGSCRIMPKTWLAGEFGKVGTGAQADFDFVGYRFDLKAGRVRPTQDRWQNLQEKILEILSLPTCLVRQFMSLVGLLSHREASSPRPTSYEAHTVAPQKQLAGTRVPRKDYSNPQGSSSPLTLVVGRGKCSHRPTITPKKICSANLYRCIKRRVGRSLRRAHRQRVLVSARKQHAHKLPRAKGSFSSLEAVSRPLYRQDSSSSNRHYGGVLHKQRRGYEVRPSLCSTLENYNLVHQEAGDSQGTAHPRQAERSSRQVIQAGPDHSNGMVPPPRGFPSDL